MALIVKSHFIAKNMLLISPLKVPLQHPYGMGHCLKTGLLYFSTSYSLFPTSMGFNFKLPDALKQPKLLLFLPCLYSGADASHFAAKIFEDSIRKFNLISSQLNCLSSYMLFFLINIWNFTPSLTTSSESAGRLLPVMLCWRIPYRFTSYQVIKHLQWKAHYYKIS